MIGLNFFDKCQDRSESELLLKIVTLSPPDYRIQYCFRVPSQIQFFCDSSNRQHFRNEKCVKSLISTWAQGHA